MDARCHAPRRRGQRTRRDRETRAHRIERRADQRQQPRAGVEQVGPALRRPLAGDPADRGVIASARRFLPAAASHACLIDLQRARCADRMPALRYAAAYRRRRRGRAQRRGKPSRAWRLGQHARKRRPQRPACVVTGFRRTASPAPPVSARETRAQLQNAFRKAQHHRFPRALLHLHQPSGAGSGT